MWNVYKRTCTVSGKSYIGLTKSSIEKRWYGGKGYGSVMGAAVKKYGVDAWEHTLLSRHKTEEAAIRAEAKNIVRFGTLAPGGYNVLPTGTTNPLNTELGLANLRAARKGQYTEKQKEYNRSKRGKGAPWLLGDGNPMRRADVREKVRAKLVGRVCEWLRDSNHHMKKGNALAAAHGDKIRGRWVVNDGSVCKAVPQEEAEQLLSAGWVRGRIPGKKRS
jgi:hypothetical protein